MTSCNNQPKPADTTAPTTAKPALISYKAMVVQHTVKDFDSWNAAFNKRDSLFKANGITDASIARVLGDENNVIVAFTISDLQKAKDLISSPMAKEAMMSDGVTGTPSIGYWNVLRDDTSFLANKERVMITHHVKDFDTWLKAYDAEGVAARAANGMMDRVLARGIDDPNSVSLIFAITDTAKANARMNSPELKKIMTDGGVDGPVTVTHFKWVKL